MPSPIYRQQQLGPSEPLRLPHWRTELTAATRGELGAESNIPRFRERNVRVGERERACERERERESEGEGEGERGERGSELRRDDASRLARPKTKVRPRLKGGV